MRLVGATFQFLSYNVHFRQPWDDSVWYYNIYSCDDIQPARYVEARIPDPNLPGAYLALELCREHAALLLEQALAKRRSCPQGPPNGAPGSA